MARTLPTSVIPKVRTESGGCASRQLIQVVRVHDGHAGIILGLAHVVTVANCQATANEKKTGVGELLAVFAHAGLLDNGPPGHGRVILQLVIRHRLKSDCTVRNTVSKWIRVLRRRARYHDPRSGNRGLQWPADFRKSPSRQECPCVSIKSEYTHSLRGEVG